MKLFSIPTAWTILVSATVLLSFGCRSMSSQHSNSSGVRFFQEGKYEEALAQFQAAKDQDPENADAYYNIAAVNHHIGHVGNNPVLYKQAEEYYKLCLTKNPNHVSAYRGLAVWYMEQGRNAEAYELLKAWGEAFPTHPEPKIEMARLYQENEQLPEAIDYLSAAVALDATNARALRALGYLRELNSDYSQAIVNYRYSLQHDPSQKDLEERITQLQGKTNLR